MAKIQDLFESGLLDEETKEALQEAWDARLIEAREEVATELREEFVKRYEHDKLVMVEAADKMFEETLHKELGEFNQERKQFVEGRVQYKKMVRNNAKAIREFASKRLVGEIKELREDRKQLADALRKFENFSIRQLTKELTEFHNDKKELVEQKVRLVSNAKTQLDETKTLFVKKAAIVVEGMVEGAIRKEITQFRHDIADARKNNFGRRIFEAFAAEYMASQYSDGTQAKKLLNAVTERETKLEEAMNLIGKQNTLLNNADSKIKLVENRFIRHKKLNELLRPLPKDKKAVMSDLLENVQTSKLDAAYKKHIKFVLKEATQSRSNSRLDENREYRSEVRGNRKPLIKENNEIEDEIVHLKKLAGI